LTKKVADYLEKDTSKGLPRNRELVESVGEIQRAALKALWTDDKVLFPEADTQKIWWEVWLRSGDDPDGIVQFFKQHADHIGIDVSDEVIHFPDRTVVFAAHGTKAQMSQSVNLLNCVAELRMTKETADFFSAMDAIEQREWMERFAGSFESAFRRLPGCLSSRHGSEPSPPAFERLFGQFGHAHL
jgi:hypothetical protein